MSNPFFTQTDEDIDDDEFLKNSRRTVSTTNGYGGRGYGGTGQSSRPDPQEQLLQQKREIEERTLASATRSIGLLYESERTGQATAEELVRQKEQLKQSEARLQDINSTLKQSERHLQGIKSVFGGIRNYFKGGGSVPGGASATASAVTPSEASRAAAGAAAVSDTAAGRLETVRESSHPGLRVQGKLENATTHPSTSQDVDAALDGYLDQMSVGLAGLKGLAQNLNSELEEQNDLIDRIDNEASKAGITIGRQNKDMNKLLGKK